MSPPTVIKAAIAILYQDGRFLLQLRDDIPTIVYPNQWACFGGHMDPGEEPEAALYREVDEEIGYTVPEATFFKEYRDPGVIRYVFACPLTVELGSLELKEGWDMGLFTPEEIRIGSCRAPRDEQPRSIAIPHQALLLDYI
ncbi:Nucleoside triphosphatase NudI [Acaryochloris thomasi RCC1774]|uniref:Nucleoside triphosphatase NudI n=1 Tax=Acaryochloris thomasi RCC1774 TaxID=1764569 RepID=A0A2W1JJM8_9CYAN|nr:NUDIX hydrolase [Acaryochloris thomasi]PZD73628.1 Nucleoside triphosphatase NudI [Acaryochloris thomasi RCC1774]